MILALKTFEFRRVKYEAGDPLPESILRSVDLRELQRLGYVPEDANAEMARAPRVASRLAAAPDWLVPDADALPAEAVAKPSRRGRKGPANAPQ